MEADNTLSLFVDESGILGEPATASRFYILGLVLHDQRVSIAPAAAELARRLEGIGIKDLCFHAGPILRGNNGFSFMTYDLRRRIFHRMRKLVLTLSMWRPEVATLSARERLRENDVTRPLQNFYRI